MPQDFPSRPHVELAETVRETHMSACHKIFFEATHVELAEKVQVSISIAKSTVLNLHDWTGALAITQIYKAGSVSNRGRRGETLRGRVEGGYHLSLMFLQALTASGSDRILDRCERQAPLGRPEPAGTPAQERAGTPPPSRSARS